MFGVDYGGTIEYHTCLMCDTKVECDAHFLKAHMVTKHRRGMEWYEEKFKNVLCVNDSNKKCDQCGLYASDLERHVEECHATTNDNRDKDDSFDSMAPLSELKRFRRKPADKAIDLSRKSGEKTEPKLGKGTKAPSGPKDDECAKNNKAPSGPKDDTCAPKGKGKINKGGDNKLWYDKNVFTCKFCKSESLEYDWLKRHMRPGGCPESELAKMKRVTGELYQG